MKKILLSLVVMFATISAFAQSGTKEVIWTNEVNTAISWNGVYRFGLNGNDGGNECIATFEEAIWNRIKTEKFGITIEPTAASNVRITTGWWDADYPSKEFNCNSNAQKDENGNTIIEINLADATTNILELVDTHHLLFTGSDYQIVNIFLYNSESSVKDIKTQQSAAPMYNLNGQRIASPKGIYIQNGKKYIAQ